MTTFDTPGSHTFNCTSAGNYIVSCYAGGGGGGGGGGLLAHSGGGGGGGAFARSTVALTVGTYPVVVGAGGAGGSYSSGTGGTGGDSSFNGGAVVAKGGTGANGSSAGTGGSAAASVGQVKDQGLPGVSGSGGVGSRGGSGGGPLGGAGGAGGEGSHNAGYPGADPGGGGGGGRNLNGGVGGAGGAGRVIIEPAPLDVNGGFEQLVFTTAGSNHWTAPYDGHVVVECVGGGGGGRGGWVLGSGGNGGGGGEYRSSVVPVQAGVQYPFTVGAAGIQSNYGQADSVMTDGGDSTFGAGLVVAKGGGKATRTAAGAGGTGGVGDVAFAGVTGGTTSVNNGASGGASGFGSSWSGAGGAGSTGTPTNHGYPGESPGGGGGGGRLNNGDGAPGAPGGVRISYYTTLGSVVVDGERKPIVKASLIEGGVKKPLRPSRIEGGVRKFIGRLLSTPSVYVRPYPTYLPAGEEAKFNLDTGGFNFHAGNTARIKAAFTKAETQLAHFVVLGDSVGEGWTYLNDTLPYNHSADWLHAFPLFLRDELASTLSVPVAGTGLVRSHGPMNTYDTQRWSHSGWTNGYHFIRSNNKTATFTSDKPGTRVSVYLIDDLGQAEIRVDGVLHTTFTGTATQVVKRVDITGLDNTQHTVDITAKGYISILGANCYNDTGIIMHNLSQGGAQASGSGQDCWADMSHHVNNMLPVYKQSACYNDAQPDVVIIELGGNDFARSVPETTITGAFHTIAQQWPSSDVVIVMPSAGSSSFTTRPYPPFWEACYDLALTYDYPLFDFQWLSGGYTVLSSQGMVGDNYGHLNQKGAEYVGKLVARTLLA